MLAVWGCKFRLIFFFPNGWHPATLRPAWTILSKRRRSRSSGSTSMWNSARTIGKISSHYRGSAWPAQHHHRSEHRDERVHRRH